MPIESCSHGVDISKSKNQLLPLLLIEDLVDSSTCSGYFDISYNLTTHLTYASDSSTAGPGQLTSRTLYRMHAANGSSTLSLPVTTRVPPPITVRVLAAVKKLPCHYQAPLPSLSGTCLLTVRHLHHRCQAPPSSLSGTSIVVIRHLPPSLSGSSLLSKTSLITVRHLFRRCQAPALSLLGTSIVAVRHLHCRYQAPPSSSSGTPGCCQAPPSLLLGTSLVTVRYLPHHHQVPLSSPLSTPSSPSLSSLAAPRRCCQHCCHSWFVIVSGSSSLSSALLLFLVSLL